MKKLLSFTLSIIMLLSAIIFVPSVSGADIKESNGYKYKVLSDGTAKIVKYYGDEINLKIPTEFDGFTVSSIGKGAFEGNEKIKSVVIPESVTKLGTYIFSECINLEKVTFGKGITKIPDGTFHCTAIKSYKIPSQVNRIGADVFPEKLESLTFGKSMQYFYVSDIAVCTFNLKEIKVSGNNNYYKSKDGMLYNKKMTKLVICPRQKKINNFSIPASVRTVGKWSFFHSPYLKKVILGKKVNKIGKNAFSGCEQLSEITIPKTVLNIEERAFAGCRKVKKLKIESNKKLEIDDYAFAGLTSIKCLTVTKVSGDSTFSSCNSLCKLKIPKSVKTISNSEFLNCESLKTVTIPSSVKKIGKRAFGYMYNYDYDFYYKIDNFTIKGKKGSAAQKYAKANGFKFVAIQGNI